MYEGGLRVPMVVRWPGKVKPGRQSDAVWTFADVLPTFAEIGGAKLAEDLELDGVSVVPTLLGKEQGGLADRFLYWEFHEKGFQQASRWKDWKAVRRKRTWDIELYDLAKDIGENTDVAKDNPDVIKKFEEFLEGARTESFGWQLD